MHWRGTPEPQFLQVRHDLVRVTKESLARVLVLRLERYPEIAPLVGREPSSFAASHRPRASTIVVRVLSSPNWIGRFATTSPSRREVDTSVRP